MTKKRFKSLQNMSDVNKPLKRLGDVSEENLYRLLVNVSLQFYSLS